MFDIRAYIESGVLEAYVSGMLDAEGVQEVEGYKAIYPEIDAEIKLITQALKQFAEMNAPDMQSSMKEEIWTKINDQSVERTTAKVIPLGQPTQSNTGIYKLLVAASVVGLLLSLGGNYYLYNEWQRTQNELASAKSEKSILADDLNASKASYTIASSELTVLRNPNNRIVKMVGLEIAPQAWAMVYWDTLKGKVFIDPADLPIPPSGKQYQLWAIADGQPVDAGVFVVDSAKRELQPVKDIRDAQMFAVTLEPAGGSASPTLANMYVAGKLL